MLNWWIRLRLRSLRTDLELLLILLLLLRKLLRILLLVRLLVLVLGKLLAHYFSRLWRYLLLLRSHEIVLLGLRYTILSIILYIKASVNRLRGVNGIHCVDNAIPTSVSALYRTDIGRRITLRNAIYLLLL